MGDKKYDKAAHDCRAVTAQQTDNNSAQTPPCSASHVATSEVTYPAVDILAHRRRPLKIFATVLGVLIVLLGIVYVGVSLYFTDHFMPNSAIANMDVSLMGVSDIRQTLADSAKDHRVSIKGQGFFLELKPDDIELKADENEVVSHAFFKASPWTWPLELLKTHDATEVLTVSFNAAQLENIVRAAVTTFNETATPPEDACVIYDKTANAFIVKPETVGTKLNPDAVLAVVNDAVMAFESTVRLTPEHLKQPAVYATDEHLKAIATSANAVITADFPLTMAGAVVRRIDADLISQWVVFDDTTATLDDGALIAWVDEIAGACTTVGTERTYTRPDGKEITVAGGPYGFSVDRDMLVELVRTGVLEGDTQTVEVPTTSEGAVYNGAGAQDWGARYCDIDLAEQYVRFYDESGALIWEAPCVSGEPNPAQITPTGVYQINLKGTQVKLKGTNLDGSQYESIVRYWMPFVDNMIGLHDADWQPLHVFGTDWYQNGGGSHGCVNLPVGAAAELYRIIEIGDVVVSHW